MYSNIFTHIRVSVLACCPCICLLAVAERKKKKDISKSRQSSVETSIVFKEAIKEGMISLGQTRAEAIPKGTRHDKVADGGLFSATTLRPLPPPPPPSATADRR